MLNWIHENRTKWPQKVWFGFSLAFFMAYKIDYIDWIYFFTQKQNELILFTPFMKIELIDNIFIFENKI